MTENSAAMLDDDNLSEKTFIFGLHLWAIVGICVGAAFVLLLFLISICFTFRRRTSSRNPKSSTMPSSLHDQNQQQSTIPYKSKEIKEIRVVDLNRTSGSKTLAQALHKHHSGSQNNSASLERQNLLPLGEGSPIGVNKIQVNIGKEHRITFPDRGGPGGGSSHGSAESRSAEQAPAVVPEVSHLGWGHWYTLRELEVATNMFSDQNVLGEGGYGIVFHGVLEDKTQVAVKNLLNNRYQSVMGLFFYLQLVSLRVHFV